MANEFYENCVEDSEHYLEENPKDFVRKVLGIVEV